MSHLRTSAAVGVLLLTAVACSDTSGTQPTQAELSLVSAAFSTAAPGYDSLSSSYNANGMTGTFAPRRRGDAHGGPGNAGPGFSGLMGGGIRDDFNGGVGMGPGLGRGPFGDHTAQSTCTSFDAATGIVTCTPIVRDSLVINRTFKFSTAAGVAQAARDSATTDRIETTRSVTGSTTFTPRSRGGFGDRGFGPGGAGGPSGAGVEITSARTVVTSSSRRVVTGLAAGGTQRTVNGASAGRETTEGTNTTGAFTSVRVMGDTTAGVIIPVVASGYPYPTAGTVTRSMNVTVTYAGGSPVASSRREVVTYDGTATAKVSITRDGQTKQCTMALPRGRPVCP
jgi:hypothetical protein